MQRRQFLASGGTAVGLAVAGLPATVRASHRRERPTGESLHFGTTGYDVGVDAETELDDAAPASLDVTVTGDRIDLDAAVEIRVSLTNEADEVVTVSTGPPLPFGALGFASVDGHGEFLAWSDAYGFEEPERWADCQRHLVWRDSVEATSVDPGEALTSTYRLSSLTHGIGPGTYEGSLRFGVSREGSDERYHATVEATASVDPSRDSPTAEYERPTSVEPRNADDFDGRLDVEVLEPLADTHPGLVRVTFTSEWDRRREVETLGAFPIGRFVGESDAGDRLVLLDADVYAPGYVRRDDEWRSTVVPCQDRSYRWSEHFDAGESVSRRYVVAAHPEDGFPAPGEYEFTARYETGGEDSLTKEEQAAVLGFTIELGDVPGGYRAASSPRGSESSGGRSTGAPASTSTATPDSTSSGTDSRTATETDTGAGSGDGTASPDVAATPSAASADEEASKDDGGGALVDRNTPATDDQSGFGVGATLAGLSGWLASRRLRESDD